MTFDEVLEQVRELLQSKGRAAYRALKRRFELDDEYLEDLKAELIDAEQVARDEDGKVLVWKGGTDEAETENRRNGESVGEKAQGVKGEKEKDFGPRTSDLRRQTSDPACRPQHFWPVSASQVQ